MRIFLRQSIKGGRCRSFNQNYKSTISDENFNIVSNELNVNGNVCEIIEKFFEYTNKHRKRLENEYVSPFKGYRDIIQDERTTCINNKINKLTIHKNLQKLNLIDVMMDFDAT